MELQVRFELAVPSGIESLHVECGRVVVVTKLSCLPWSCAQT